MHAITDEMAYGRKAAGRVEEERYPGSLQADKSRAGHVPHGPAENQRLGKRRMDSGNFLRHFQGPVGGGDGEVQEEEVEVFILRKSLKISGDDLRVVHELGGDVHGVGDGSHSRNHVAELLQGPG